MEAPEIKLCECCGQIIATSTALSHKRHLETILSIHDVSLKDMQKRKDGRNGSRAVSRARNHYWFLLVIEDHWSLERAAETTGHKHHAALSGVRNAAVWLGLTQNRRASIKRIGLAYWKKLGYSEEEALDLVSA